MTEPDVYKALQQHLDAMPGGFPATESGIEIQILKRLFTPKEADLATKLVYSTYPTESLESIFDRLKGTHLSMQELELTLDVMVSKGLLHFKLEDGVKYYNNAQWVVGIYEFQVNKLTKELNDDVSRYHREAYGSSLFKSQPTQLRVIPVGKSIKPEDSVASYDDIRAIIPEIEGPFMVTSCICRQRRNLESKNCRVTERNETCLGFGTFAKMYIDLGWGREISRNELMEIVDTNETEGLVLQPSNSKHLDFLCSCCGCCCGLLSGKGALPKPIDFFTTNYHSVMNSDLCTLCGTCVGLCQMKALSIQDGLLMINLDRCIGCGVCVASCPEEAISLKRRENDFVPPETMDETFAQIRNNRIRT